MAKSRVFRASRVTRVWRGRHTSLESDAFRRIFPALLLIKIWNYSQSSGKVKKEITVQFKYMFLFWWCYNTLAVSMQANAINVKCWSMWLTLSAINMLRRWKVCSMAWKQMINQRFGVFLHRNSQVQYKHNATAKNPNNKTKGKMSSKIMQVLHIPLTMVPISA